MTKLAEYSAVPAAFLYCCRHYCHHKQKKNDYISIFIMILNILILHSHQYNFIFISLLVLKNKILGKNWKKNISHWRVGGMFDNGNVNWCMLGRAFLCRTVHFAVKPGFFVSNECYNSCFMMYDIYLRVHFRTTGQ